MSSWLQVTRKNCHNKSDDNINLETTVIVEKVNNDINLVQNKHLNSISEIYNNILERMNNGYFTILSIDNNNRRRDFINMIFDNFNYGYHVRYDNFNSDSDIQDNLNSDDEDFVPIYSKFAYH
jgi:hypothetical protein